MASVYDDRLKRAADLQAKVRSLCPENSGTIKVEDRKAIRDYVQELYTIVAEQNGVILEKELQLQGRNFSNNSHSISNGFKNASGSKVSYADKLRGSATSVVVKVQPKAKQTADDTKKQLVKQVNVIEKEISVRKVKSGKDGALLVECESKKDAEKLRVTIAEKMSETVSAKELFKRNPTVVIYGIEKEVDGKDLIDKMYKQNAEISSIIPELGDLEKEIKIIRYFSGSNNKWTKHAVLSVSARIRSVLVNKYVKIGWKHCQVKDHKEIKYCFKCLKVGHISSKCTEAEVCKKCGDNHDSRNCKVKEMKCIVCTRRKVQGAANLNHEAYGKKCSSVQKIMQEEEKRINYNV